MKKSVFYFLAFAITITSFTACKDDDATPTDESTVFDLTFDISHLYDNEALALSSSALNYTDGTGTALSFTDVKYLLSNIVLHKSDGSDYNPTDGQAFISTSENRTNFTLADVPKGDYTGLSFKVGLDEETNHGDPNQYEVSHPFSPTLNLMHWSWSAGYIFLTLEGLYMNDMEEKDGFVYHVATDNFLMDFEFRSLNYTMDADKTVKLSFHTDQLFSNPNTIDIRAMGDTSHSGDDGGLAEMIHNNMQNVITVDAVE